MNSWDCFDTLVARRYYYPKSIFFEIADKISDPTFVDKRIAAERKTKTIDEIYQRLPGYSKSLELETEFEHLYPIKENLDQVKDGDIIVSDMYLPQDFIKRVLIKCGLNADVKIIVTKNGKKNGWIWDELNLENIDTHTGDAPKGDYLKPQARGVKSYLYQNCWLNELEKHVEQNNPHLAYWMRYVRLQCPYTDTKRKSLWIDQANLNLPILALATLELPDTEIAFTYRDSVFWHPLYEAMTNRIGTKLLSSRHCLYNPSEEFKNYVKETTKYKLIVDLQGTGQSLHNFFEDDNFNALYISTPAPVLNQYNEVCEPNIFVNSLSKIPPGAGLEQMNSSSAGQLIDYNQDGPVFQKTERDLLVASVQQEAMTLAIESAKYFNVNKDLTLLKYLIQKVNDSYTKNNTSWRGKPKT